MGRFGGIPVEGLTVKPSTGNRFGGIPLDEEKSRFELFEEDQLNQQTSRPFEAVRDPLLSRPVSLQRPSSLGEHRTRVSGEPLRPQTLAGRFGLSVLKGVIDLANTPEILVRAMGLPSELTPEERVEREKALSFDLTPAEGFLGKVVGAVGESVPAMIAGGAVGGLARTTLGRAATFAATQVPPVAAQTYEAALKETDEPGRARVEAAVASGITFVTNLFPGAALLRQTKVGDKILKSAVWRTIQRVKRVGPAEAAQEYVEGALQDITTEVVRRNEDLSPQLVFDALTRPERLVELTAGGVVGTIAGGVKETSNIRTEKWKIKFRDGLVRAGVVTEAESKTYEDDLGTLYRIASLRREGQEVEVVSRPDGSTEVKSKPDLITWEERQIVDNNPGLVEEIRAQRREGKTVDVERLKPRVDEAKSRGFLKSPSVITDDLKMREVIGRDQTNLLRKIFILRRDNKLSVSERWTLADVVEKEFVERMERRLQKRDDTPQGAKTQVSRWLKDDKTISETDKPVAIKTIQGLIDRVKTSTTTQREALARVLDDLKTDLVLKPSLEATRKRAFEISQGPESGTPEANWLRAQRELQDKVSTSIRRLYDRIVTNPKLQPHSSQVRQALNKTPRSQDELLQSIDTLPAERSGALRERAKALKPGEDFKGLATEVRAAQEAYVKEVATAEITKKLSQLEKNPRREEGMRAVQKLSGKPAVSRTIAQPSQLTTLQRLKIADDVEAFEKISPEHQYLSRRWERLVKTGAMSPQEVKAARYIFSGVSPKALGTVRSLVSKKELLAEDASGKTIKGHPADYERFSRKARLARGGDRALSNFTHELFHGGYFNFLDVDTVTELDMIHAELLGEDVEPSGENATRAYDDSEGGEWTKAHQIIAEGFESPVTYDTIDYFARTPEEFFAETGSRYLLEQKVSVPALRKFWDKIITAISRQLHFLSVVRPTTSIIPEKFTKAFDAFIKGEKGKGLTFVEEEVKYIPKLQGLVKTIKPVVITDPKTGKTSVDIKALKEQLQSAPLDVALNLQHDLTKLVRQGQIERGLYNKYLGFIADEDVKAVLDDLKKVKDRPEARQSFDKPIAVGKAIADPVSTEAWMEQRARQDPNDTLRKVLFTNFERPYSRMMQATADFRRSVQAVTKETLGFDSSTSRGGLKLLNYLHKKLDSGVRRGEAMVAYALSTDSGRAQPLRDRGIEVRGKKFSANEAIKSLSAADKRFVDGIKNLIKTNPTIDKAMDFFTLKHGYTPERFEGYAPSRSSSEQTELPKDLNSFENVLGGSVDALKERVENATQPFKADGGFLSHFYGALDDLAIYGEMGREIYRAERLLTNPDFKREFTNKYGDSRYQELIGYLNNIQGNLRSTHAAFDAVINYTVKASAIKALGTNIASFLKQTFSFFSNKADNILDSKALNQALIEGAAFNSRIGRDMKAQSGVAYMRLGSQFAENTLVLGRSDPLPRLSYIQNESLFLQRWLDGRMLRITWRAAEIMAKKRGLTGEQAKEFIVERFETALARNQTTNNPLYVNQLELLAVKQPIYRGFLQFQRELNRVYNTTRRHVVKAIQQPTEQNVKQAAKAVFWSGIVNTTANVGINNLRRLAFGGLAYTGYEWFKESFKSLAGQFYLLDNAAQGILAAVDDEEDLRLKDFLGPIGGTVVDVAEAGQAVRDLATIPEDEDIISSGINRGQSKTSRAMVKLIDRSLSASSSILGLPLWMMWYQSKGLYNWNREDYRRMLVLERETERLKKNPNKNALRLLTIEKLRERINKVHRLREKGMISRESAQRLIVGELRRDQD